MQTKNETKLTKEQTAELSRLEWAVVRTAGALKASHRVGSNILGGARSTSDAARSELRKDFECAVACRDAFRAQCGLPVRRAA